MSVAEITALVMAGIAALGLLLNARKATGDATAQSVEALSALLKDFAALREQLEASEDQEDDCQAKLAGVKHELSRVLHQLSATESERDELRRAAPSMRAMKKIRGLTPSVRYVLDACRDGIAVTEKDGGRLVFVNRAFAQALGMKQEDVIAAGWRSLIHPEDLQSAETVESEAWSEGGVTDNRYRHAFGHYVKLRWHFTDYDEGLSLSIVWFERRRDSGAFAAAQDTYDN